jgi:hypothetical protein
VSARAAQPVERLLELAHALARDRVDLSPLQRDLARVHDEIVRLDACGATSTSALTSTLATALRACGLPGLADRAADPRALCGDLDRLQALLATIAATRDARA